MKIKIEKKITCSDSRECSKIIISKLKKTYPDLILQSINENDSVNGHVSISHKQNKHVIWLFIYDKDGKHESEDNLKDVVINNSTVKKYLKIFPTKSQIEKII